MRTTPTRRQRTRQNRAALAARRRIAGLSLTEYRVQLTGGLAGLPLTAEGRRWHLDFVGAVPGDARFWRVLDQARALPGGPLATFAAVYAERYGGPPAQPWPGIASRVVAAWKLLRGELMRVSGVFRAAWQRGDRVGLIEMVRADGVRARWVQDAIAELRERQLSGTLHEERRATSTLKAVGAALWQVGSGRTPEREPDERRRRRGASITATKRAARIDRAEARLTPMLNPEHFSPGDVTERLLRDAKGLAAAERERVREAINRRRGKT